MLCYFLLVIYMVVAVFFQMVESLVDCGANVNITDQHGEIALHLACAKSNYHIVGFLIKVRQRKKQDNSPHINHILTIFSRIETFSIN